MHGVPLQALELIESEVPSQHPRQHHPHTRWRESADIGVCHASRVRGVWCTRAQAYRRHDMSTLVAVGAGGAAAPSRMVSAVAKADLDPSPNPSPKPFPESGHRRESHPPMGTG